MNIGEEDFDTADNSGLSDEEKKFQDWLTAPKCVVNYSTALTKRVAGTGLWILKSPAYFKWKKEGKILWVHGQAGSGKTILITSIIHNLKLSNNPSCTVYHYFDMCDNTGTKTSFHGLLMSLLLQLGIQDHKVHPALKSLYETSNQEDYQYKSTHYQVVNTLVQITKEMVQKSHHLYIIIDALNECKDISLVLSFLAKLATFDMVRIIISHCNYPPENLKCFKISLNNNHMLDADIATVVDDFMLKRVQSLDFRAEVKATLLKTANRGFRYIECQLALIKTCASPRMIDKALSQLPMNLQETYAKTMQKCKTNDHAEDMHYLLMWLLYALEPLHIREVATILSIDMETSEIDFDAGIAGELNEFIDETLITVNTDNIVQFAHGSVKEFLLESNNNSQVREIFNFNAQLSHSVIAHMCLTYILNQDQYSDIRPYVHFTGGNNIITFDQYAVQYWAEHYQYNEGTESPYQDEITILTQTFLQGDSKNFIGWQTKFYNTGNKWPIKGTIFEDCTPLHVVALFGCKEVTQKLLTGRIPGFPKFNDISSDINIVSNPLGPAISVAAFRGYKDIVQILLRHNGNADVNIMGGYYGTAVQAAATGGHREIVEMLLEHGADASIQGGHYGNALQAAAFGGYKGIVELLLLQYNSEINTQGGYYGTTLQAAVIEGHKDIVKLLMEHNADVNIQGGYYGTPLQAAALYGDKDTFELLLKCGANVNAEGGKYGTALQAAVVSNHTHIIEILLKYNVNVNAQGGYFGTALQAAAFLGNKEIIQLLLKYGSNINAQAGEYGNALK
ncbi:ankyrin repeat-containing domain protein [Lentinula raphanica]|uniref:Ankyrin repeat-containing domain protein n=1 Tax=Lentinula raphanica TaxID=153919 RepID=A0AA38P6E9_9AGAR|nr:ankyrin repeat-containing domain protein [Lentinula raphanica]